MPRQRPAAATTAPRSAEPVSVPWPIVAVRVPPDWKRWLDEAAQARGLSVAALVRQCIRDLMIRRHDTNGGSSS